jgi:DNA-binding NarL/FixJ family response regulator
MDKMVTRKPIKGNVGKNRAVPGGETGLRTDRAFTQKAPGTPDPCAKQQRRTVIVVDDHPVTRLGVSTLIGNQSDFTVCGEAGSGQAAIELLSRIAPDLAIVDLADGTMGGVELLRNIRVLRPRMRVLVMSAQDEEIYAERALRAGATGYIMKQRPVGEIIAAVRLVLAGEVYLSEKMKGRMLNRLARGAAGEAVSAIDTLSDREMEVFRLIGDGFRTNQIAERLHLSSKTIDSHREHLKQKLGLAGGGDLVRHAIEWARR